MIEKTTPVGPPETIPLEDRGVEIRDQQGTGSAWAHAATNAMELARRSGRRSWQNQWTWPRASSLEQIMEVKRRLGIRYGPEVSLADRSEYVDVPGVDRKVMPPELGGPAEPVTQPGWLPHLIDDVVAMLVETRHTPQSQVIRGRECHYAADIDMLLMPFGKGTLAGPRDWVVAASEQLDEAYYEAWGMS